MKTHTLFADSIEAVGVDLVCAALGIGRSHAYRLARHPADQDDPDGTGAPRNDADRLYALFAVLAAHEEGERVLVRWRAEFDAAFRRFLRVRSEPVSLARLRGKAVRALHEHADVIQAAGRKDDEVCRDEIRREALEARTLLDRIILACEQPFSEDDK